MPLTAVPRHRLMSPEIRFFASPTLQRDRRTSVVLFLSTPLPSFSPLLLFLKLIIYRNSWFWNFDLPSLFFKRYPMYLSYTYMKTIIFLFLLLFISIVNCAFRNDTNIKLLNYFYVNWLRVDLLHSLRLVYRNHRLHDCAKFIRLIEGAPCWFRLVARLHPRPLPSCEFTIPWLFRRHSRGTYRRNYQR